MFFNQCTIHPSWEAVLAMALETLPANYLATLNGQSDWLPGAEKIFNAFSLPKPAVRYILLGESPYPRAESANGYAFWDDAVNELWSNTGLTKPVNRATSLRNWVKMLLVAQDYLTTDDLSQQAISHVDKSFLVKTLPALFSNFLNSGFLLLNASLVLSPTDSVNSTAAIWRPFLETLLADLANSTPDAQLLLFGNIAKQIQALPCAQHFTQLVAPHPYNLSFIQSNNVLALFSQLSLLDKVDITP